MEIVELMRHLDSYALFRWQLLEEYKTFLSSIENESHGLVLNYEKELFKELFGDMDSVKKTTHTVEIWKKRRLILSSLIHDALIEKQSFGHDYDFVYDHDYDNERYSYKKITGGSSLTFVYDPGNKKIGDSYIFGFWSSNWRSIDQETKKSLGDILAGISFKTGYSGGGVESIDDYRVRRLCFDIDKPADEIINDILDIYAQLEEKATERKSQ